MPVDIFGHTDVKFSQRTVSGGVTLSQVNNTFLRRDGESAAVGDINLNTHKLINVKDPVDAQDVATKIYVDATKVSKSGDAMTGDLKLLLNDENIRTFGVTDINAGKRVSLLLGDVDNQICHKYGQSIKIAASHGLKVTCPTGEVCQMGTYATFFKDIVMNGNIIKKLHGPRDDRDAATKLYVDTRCFKNNSGYVPNLITNDRNKNGFIVTASSELGLNLAYNVFSIIGEWISEVKTSFWIKVKCPEPVRIHKVALRGVSTGIIRNWILQASNDDDVWENLLTSNCIDEYLRIPEIDSVDKYLMYRIWVTDTDGDRPGLSYWQLYSVDSVV